MKSVYGSDVEFSARLSCSACGESIEVEFDSFDIDYYAVIERDYGGSYARVAEVDLVVKCLECGEAINIILKES